MRNLVFISLLMLGSLASAQDLTGIWRGKLLHCTAALVSEKGHLVATFSKPIFFCGS